MNVKKATLAVLIAALVALLLTFGIYRHNRAAHDSAVRSAPHSWKYLAAARNIGSGERVSPADVMVVDSIGDQPVVGAFGATDEAKVLGRIVAYPMADGMVFTSKYLAPPDSSLGLPHKIPSGMRAFSVKTNEVNDLGGFLYPGTKVDVLVALKGGSANAARSLSLVQDVEVLATGKQLAPDPSGKPIEASVVTVLVTPEDAQKIALAQEEGAIYFSLRNGEDNAVSHDKPTLFSELVGVPAQSRRGPFAHLSHPQSAGVPVETILGGQSSTQFFRGNLPVDGRAKLHATAQSKSGVE